jgi:hypothetical protein
VNYRRARRADGSHAGFGGIDYLPEPPLDPPPPPELPAPPEFGDIPAPDGLLPDAPIPELLPEDPEPEVDGDVVIECGDVVLPEVPPLLMPLPAVVPDVAPVPPPPIDPEPEPDD